MASRSQEEVQLRAQYAGRPFRVVVHGLPHFCQRLAALLRCQSWDVRYHSILSIRGLASLARDLARCDLAYTWGGRIDLGKFLWSARLLSKKKLVMLWSGSDASYAKKDAATGKLNPWVLDKVHWAVSPWIAKEVRSVGIDCEYVQASFVESVTNPPALPKKFSVLVYLPSVEKADLYGWQQVLSVARSSPSVEFLLVGLQEGRLKEIPPNMKIHGWTSNLASFLDRATVLWRPVQHDGLSFMVLEALACGRHVLYSYPLPGCTHVTNAGDAQTELERLFGMHSAGKLELNQEGMDLIERDFRPDKVRKEILRRWENIILSRDPSHSENLVQPSAGN